MRAFAAFTVVLIAACLAVITVGVLVLVVPL